MASLLTKLDPRTMITLKSRPTINYLRIKTIVIKDAKRKVDLEAQFNPESFSVTKEIDWTKEKAATRNWPTHEFSGGEAATFSLSLLFDTTQEVDDSEKDVRKYTNELFKLTLYNPDVNDYPDPPPVQVTWGPLVLFVAVVTKVEVTYVLFYPDGTPARARAEVSFSQYDISDDLKGATNPTSRTDARKTHIVQSGDRLDLIAYQEYGHPAHWRHIAEANGMLDPLDLRPGMILSLPPIP